MTRRSGGVVARWAPVYGLPSGTHHLLGDYAKSASFSVMKPISVEELTSDPMAVVARAQAGESILVLDGEGRAVEIRPASPPRTGTRPFGLCRGEFTVPDGFDDPLPAGTFEAADFGTDPDELRPEYDFGELGPGIRGKDYERAIKALGLPSTEALSDEESVD